MPTPRFTRKMCRLMQLTPLRARRRRTTFDSAATKADETVRAADLSTIAERIAGLIDGPVSEALVAILTDLYGDALARIFAALAKAPGGSAIIDDLCDDRLVGGLLVVHDLHPRSLAARVERALAAHDAVELDRIEDDVVYVRLGTPAGPAARTAIARAVAAAAPEISCVCAEVDTSGDRTLHF